MLPALAAAPHRARSLPAPRPPAPPSTLTHRCEAGAGDQPLRAPRLLVPAPILPAARMRPIGLVAPALLRADGQPAWLPARAGRQKQARESEGGAKGNADVLAAAVACGESMDGWELQMMQMLVLQGLTQSESETGAPTLPAALACQLCQMSYGAPQLPVPSLSPLRLPPCAVSGCCPRFGVKRP
jgi:hypothetical protein